MLSTIFGSDDEGEKQGEEKTENDGKTEVIEGEEGFLGNFCLNEFF